MSGLLRAHLGERILPVDPWGPIRFSILTDAFGIRLGVASVGRSSYRFGRIRTVSVPEGRQP